METACLSIFMLYSAARASKSSIPRRNLAEGVKYSPAFRSGQGNQSLFSAVQYKGLNQNIPYRENSTWTRDAALQKVKCAFKSGATYWTRGFERSPSLVIFSHGWSKDGEKRKIPDFAIKMEPWLAQFKEYKTEALHVKYNVTHDLRPDAQNWAALPTTNLTNLDYEHATALSIVCTYKKLDGTEVSFFSRHFESSREKISYKQLYLSNDLGRVALAMTLVELLYYV